MRLEHADLASGVVQLIWFLLNLTALGLAVGYQIGANDLVAHRFVESGD